MNSMKRLLSLALLAAMPLTALAKDEASKIAGTYKGETRAKGRDSREQSQDRAPTPSRHHTMTLDLGKDGTATLTQSPTGADEITSFAHWSLQGDVLKLTFDPVDKQPYPHAHHLPLRPQDADARRLQPRPLANPPAATTEVRKKQQRTNPSRSTAWTQRS